MKLRAWLTIVGVAAWSVAQGSGTPNCYEWEGGIEPDNVSLTAIGAARASRYAAGNPAYNYELQSCVPDKATGGNQSGTCTFKATLISNPNNVSTFSDSFTSKVTPVPCPPPPAECDENGPGVGEVFTATNIEGPNNYCNPVTGCKMKVKNRTGGTMTVQHSRESCGETEQDPGMPEEGDPETCEAVGDGEYCASSSGDGQCGYMNDTYICLNKVKPNECKVLGDGGRVCGASANTTPPVPDSGTPGEVAEPDGTIDRETYDDIGTTSGGTFNYYNSTTVTGSSRDPGSDGGAPSGGSPGSEGDDGDEDSGCVGETCGEGTPDLEDIGTMTDAFTGFWNDLQEVPIVDAAGSAVPDFGSAACPTWSDEFTLYGEAVEMDFSSSICSTWTEVTPVIAFVCLAFWGWVSLRVLLSA